MKKAITILLVSALAAIMLCGCKMGKCDLCGKSGILNKHEFLGASIYLCNDCEG